MMDNSILNLFYCQISTCLSLQKYECLLFQEAGHKVDTEITNAAIQEALGEEERGNGEIFKDINSYRTHIKEGGFSPYCYISTIRCIMMKGIIDKIYIYIHSYIQTYRNK